MYHSNSNNDSNSSTITIKFIKTQVAKIVFSGMRPAEGRWKSYDILHGAEHAFELKGEREPDLHELVQQRGRAEPPEHPACFVHSRYLEPEFLLLERSCAQRKQLLHKHNFSIKRLPEREPLRRVHVNLSIK